MTEPSLWRSPVTPQQIFSRQGAPAYPFYHSSGQIYWLESLTQDKGRLAVVTQHAEQDRVITPSPYQIRTAVHEYGGKAFCVYQDTVYFNNYSDGLIYAQRLPNVDQLKSPLPCEVLLLCQPVEGSIGYADISVSESGKALVAVQELLGDKENLNCITLINLSLASNDPQVLVSGADFYACPVISKDGKKLAWFQWNHPDMPWDSSEVYIADLVREGEATRVTNEQLVDGNASCSICQLGFLDDGSLVYAKDGEAVSESPDNYSNLFRWQAGQLSPLTQDLAEYGDAHWVFGQTRWTQLSSSSLVAVRTIQGQDELMLISLELPSIKCVAKGFSRLSHLSLSPCGDKVAMVAQYADRESELIEIEPVLENPQVSVKRGQSALLKPSSVSVPKVIAFATKDGAQAFANFYAPHSAEASRTNPPTPAVVMVHGGPTSRADTSLSMLVQYFTSSGFAVIDVNHRGSTGLGRAYRQHLLGLWGEVDASDIVDAVTHFVNEGRVDASKVCIRGGSAGGYAVLRALTEYPNTFCAGACYYGIGNLITLSEITHKFESHYTDKLVGEAFDPVSAKLPTSRYQSRSPIFNMDKVRSPVILFQGLDDKVVPPDVSREVVSVLEKGGVPHEYIEYAGEGHGFRQAATRIDALEKEMAFYQQVLD
ncbi:MAG: dipeptidyl aminopeptidase/acylaminoacyl peptidase [Saprospiraceae bacterium]|jgi:dipeptidyl aminopeptidase/acylaminoacyl peptidase